VGTRRGGGRRARGRLSSRCPSRRARRRPAYRPRTHEVTGTEPARCRFRLRSHERTGSPLRRCCRTVGPLAVVPSACPVSWCSCPCFRCPAIRRQPRRLPREFPNVNRLHSPAYAFAGSAVSSALSISSTHTNDDGCRFGCARRNAATARNAARACDPPRSAPAPFPVALTRIHTWRWQCNRGR
jgi:hypothetical protein